MVWSLMKEIFGHKYATTKELDSYEVEADMVIHFLDYKCLDGKSSPIEDPLWRSP
jgi:hypothetical protein